MEQKEGNKKFYIIVAIVVLILLGFHGYRYIESNKYEVLLQKEFNNQYKRWGRGSFCYKVGNVQFPYIDKGYPDEFVKQVQQNNDGTDQDELFSNFWENQNKYQLNFLLPIYSEIGLLSRQIVDGTDYYQYDLTQEGKKYQAEYGDDFVFCYGYQKVLNVTSIKKEESLTYKGKDEVIVTYNYQLDDVPWWLSNERFMNTYQSDLNKNRTGEETFIEGNGKIFIDGNFNSYIYDPKLPRLIK